MLSASFLLVIEGDEGGRRCLPGWRSEAAILGHDARIGPERSGSGLSQERNRLGRTARLVSPGCNCSTTIRLVHAGVVVLNGGSSSGKSSIARCLQDVLGPTWLTLGVDDLVRALPGGDKPPGGQVSIDLMPDGSVMVGEDFRRAEAAWYQGLVAIGRSGTGLIIDEVFLGGRSSQDRLAGALSDLAVMWVGVRCAPEVAAARELGRPERVVGMARLQAERVHEGVRYDLVVDTTHASAPECASSIAAHILALDD